MFEYLPKQLEALQYLSTSHHCEVLLFGGAAGGAKSALGCAWQIQRRLKYEGTRGLIGRSKLHHLKLTTLKTFYEVAGMMNLRNGVDFSMNFQSNTIRFYNGSEIFLKDMFLYPSDPNFDSLGSLEITDWFVDEVSQVSKKGIDILRSRVRYKLTEHNLEPKGLMTCNPSKGWLYNDIYIPHKQGSLSKHYQFLQSLPTDNPYLPKSYYETLSRLPEKDRRRLLDGDWEYDEAIDNLFDYEDLIRCWRDEQLQGEWYLTADIARLGKDRTVIGVWRGLQLIETYELRKQKITDIVAHIRSIIKRYDIKLSNVICDEDGVGGGAVDALACRGFRNGSRATKPDRFVHLKAECYFKLAELVEQNKVIFCNSIRDILLRELDMIRRKQPESDGRLAVTGKEEITKQHGISPDYADMVMMRMYFDLFPNYGKYSWA